MNVTRETVVGLFDDAERAREAIQALKDAGFKGGDISVLMPNRDEAGTVARETGTNKMGEGAATGLVAGGVLGGLAGWLTGVGVLAIPGVGPLVAAGALAAALGGAAAGGAVGGIAGALVGMGIPDDEARFYEQEVRAGRTLLAVKAGDRSDEAERVLLTHGAYNVQHPKNGVADRTAAATSRNPIDR
jgi:hypothetical protein